LEGEYQKSLAALEGSFVSLNWVSAKNGFTKVPAS
jgi:hypothetical protein